MDVFVVDLQTSAIERVSVGAGGIQGGSGSDEPSISADGRFVAFRSNASNLVAGDTNLRADIFVYDCVNRTTERMNVPEYDFKPTATARALRSVPTVASWPSSQTPGT